MKSKSMKYMYKHSESDCHYGRTCVFPHSKLEEEVWNILLYFTETLPELELPDRTAAVISHTEVSKLSSCNQYNDIDNNLLPGNMHTMHCIGLC